MPAHRDGDGADVLDAERARVLRRAAVGAAALGLRGRRRAHRPRREGHLPLRQEEPRPPQRLHQGASNGLVQGDPEDRGPRLG